MKKYSLILGSGSPRRKELLEHLKLPFLIKTSEIDEVSDKSDATEFALDIALKKAKAVLHDHDMFEHPLIIAADTIVVCDNEILGKPKDLEDSRNMLKKLSGRNHEVITAVALIAKNLEDNQIKQHVFSVSSQVTFDEIDERSLELYVQSKDGLDKAGSYGIQGMGLVFVKSVEGSYSNIVGLPLNEVYQELKSFIQSERPEDVIGPG